MPPCIEQSWNFKFLQAVVIIWIKTVNSWCRAFWPTSQLVNVIAKKIKSMYKLQMWSGYVVFPQTMMWGMAVLMYFLKFGSYPVNSHRPTHEIRAEVSDELCFSRLIENIIDLQQNCGNYYLLMFALWHKLFKPLVWWLAALPCTRPGNLGSNPGSNIQAVPIHA